MAAAEPGHPALTDQRTGLPNRVQFETVYRFLFDGADRGVPLTLMMVRMEAEEESSFLSGARQLASSTRSSDLLAHLGDGLFATLLLGCNLHGARLAADRMADVLSAVRPLKFAIGLAPYHEDMKESSELVDAATRAVDEARAAGGGTEIGVA